MKYGKYYPNTDLTKCPITWCKTILDNTIKNGWMLDILYQRIMEVKQY